MKKVEAVNAQGETICISAKAEEALSTQMSALCEIADICNFNNVFAPGDSAASMYWDFCDEMGKSHYDDAVQSLERVFDLIRCAILKRKIEYWDF